ncbi:MAG TPA: hypothetical protein VK985_10905 [Rariglobus sp.]|nr:hypothetical protein [Rariglobus sp.]
MPAPLPLATGHRSVRSLRHRRGGFALLITITLLAFLVLLLVSLASLTRVETQVAGNNQQLAQARQNALMALNLALGQLQKTAGPDQRVTTRADLQPLATTATPSPYPTIDPASGTSLTATTATALSNIDTYWRASRNRQWTGAWRNSNNDPATYDSNNPAKYNPVAVLQSWLVSGNENATTGDTFKPSDTVTGLTAASTALDRILDAVNRPHRLLVKASAGVTTAADLARAVTAPEIAITATNVPGTDGTATPVGHYAWWVGDEGVKARANLVDPYAKAPSGETPAEKLTRETTRRQSAQRPAIEAMTTTGTDGLGSAYPANSADLLKILTPDQLRCLSAASTFPDELKSRYHDLSVSSRGVLADVKNGGLKADLSYLFGLPNLTDFRTALRAYYGTNAIAPLNPNPAIASQLANSLINPLATVRATFPTMAVDGGNFAAATQFGYTSSWEQLWSFANQGSSFNAAGQATSRIQTATEHGLYPLIIQTKMFYRLRFEGGSAVADPDGTMVNRTGTMYVDTLPLFVLANPYAVPLAAAEYQVRVAGSSPQLVFGKIESDATTPPSPTTDFSTVAYPVYTPTWAGNRIFFLRTTGMAAGEAQVFTIDPDPAVNTTIDGEDRILVARQTGNSVAQMDSKPVYMKNAVDPSPALTYRVGTTASPYPPVTIPADQTHVALRLGRSSINTILFQGYVPGDPQGYLKLLQYTAAQVFTADAEYTSGENYIFLVDPMSDGIRQGGGVNSIVNQPPTTDRPAAKPPNVGSVFFSHQQAPFLQVNYRTNQIMWTGNDGIPNSSHPLEWARRFTKTGATGSVGTTPNPWFTANLLLPDNATTSTANVRWGLVNIGEGNTQTTPPASIGGANALVPGSPTYNAGFYNYLYDIPRPGQPLASLGQLQHFNTTGYYPLTTGPSQVSSLSSWQTNYAFANSYPQPRVPRDKLFEYKNSAPVTVHYHFDGSSIWNDIFWDRFTFSTYPQTGSFDFATGKLPNSRYTPFRDPAAAPWTAAASFRGDGNPATAANARVAASNLLVNGAFNINSTSVEAWKAVLSSLKNVRVGTEAAPSAPFARTLTPAAGSTGAATGTSANSWAGFRDLSAADLQSLAEEIVIQVRKRGPFLSLSDFVNRRLITAADDPLNLGLSGPLQSAIDATINQPSRLAPAFNTKSSVSSTNPVTAARSAAIAEAGYILPASLAGFPGYLLQGDVLSALGASLSARSDTFTIRTYGDTVNAVTKEVIGRAWCEAIVQRLPDYVDGTPAVSTPTVGSAAETFGRRFQIISFRWLNPDEV